MEDSVTENEKSQVLRSSIDYEDEKQGGAKEVIINGSEDDVEEKPAVGLMSQLISNFTPAEGGKEQDEGEIQGKEDRNDHHVEDKPIGLINQIISSFGPGDKEQDEGEKEIKVSVESEEKEEENRGGGGLFSGTIMSNLISSPVSSPRAQDDKQAGKDVIDNAKTPEKQSNGLPTRDIGRKNVEAIKLISLENAPDSNCFTDITVLLTQMTQTALEYQAKEVLGCMHEYKQLNLLYRAQK